MQGSKGCGSGGGGRREEMLNLPFNEDMVRHVVETPRDPMSRAPERKGGSVTDTEEPRERLAYRRAESSWDQT